MKMPEALLRNALNIFLGVFFYICQRNGSKFLFHRVLDSFQFVIQNFVDIASYRTIAVWIFMKMK